MTDILKQTSDRHARIQAMRDQSWAAIQSHEPAIAAILKDESNDPLVRMMASTILGDLAFRRAEVHMAAVPGLNR